ncbi:hypothetical protein KFK09_013629 [Dendrobium nobile]|uniref:Uncharacterized protein n=1 Tax=Dendrobium nobile TaxID=94219 RepID=A0A8T3B9D9_DENNO|nr:hypothetical protein KFK09_013629 [Dendrobium nobile]
MASPLEIGAQGTIGSLISHEVEYFRKVDLGGWRSSQRIKSSPSSSESNSFKLKKESDSNNAKKKKKKKKKEKKKEKKKVKEGKYLPSICSAIEISENTSRKESRIFLQK